MLDIKLAEYCEDCPYIEGRFDSNTLYDGDKPVVVKNIITCDHMNRCARVYSLAKKGE